MASEGAARKPFQLRRVLKFSGALILLVAVALIGAHIAWKYSGSDQWRLLSDQDGVQVYSKKVPGDTLLKFRAHRRIPGKIEAAVLGMLDVHLDGCEQWFPGCSSVKPVEVWDSKKLYQTYIWQVNFSPKMTPREFLLQTKVSPDVADRMVTVEFIAQPDRLPRSNCCYRIEHLHNAWKFAQAEHGQLDVELTQDMDLGLPYFMMNMNAPEFIRKLFADLPNQFNDPQYQDKAPDFLQGFEEHS